MTPLSKGTPIAEGQQAPSSAASALPLASSPPAKAPLQGNEEYYSKIQQIQAKFVGIANTLLSSIQNGEAVEDRKIQHLRLAADLSEMMREYLKESASTHLNLDHTQGEKALQLAKQQADLQAFLQTKDIEMKKAMQAIQHEQEKHVQAIKSAESERKLKEEEAHLHRDEELLKTVFDLRKKLQGNTSLPSDQALTLHNIVYDAAIRNNGQLLRGALVLNNSIDALNFKSLTPLQRTVQDGNLDAAKLLVKEGASISKNNPKGRGLLHLAVRSGNVEMVEWVHTITKKKLLETKDARGETPLFYAVRKGQTAIANILHRLGATLNTEDSHENSLLHLIAHQPNPSMIKWLFETRHPFFLDAPNNEGLTPLQVAVINGQVEFAQKLSEQGANVTLMRKDGANLLHLAAETGNANLIEWLIERKVSLHAKTSTQGYTPLACALFKGKLAAAQKLVSKGAKADVTDSKGKTLLHIAAAEGHFETLGWLLVPELKQTLDAKDSTGATPLTCAVLRGHKRTAQFLLQRGAALNIQDNDGNTLVHQAALSGSLDMLAWVLSNVKKTEVNQANKQSLTPLAAAVSKGFLDGAKLLVSHGADPNIRTQEGNTLLHLVPQKSSKEIFEWLLTLLPGSINATNNQGMTPLAQTIQSGDTIAAKYIHSRKALTSIPLQNGQTLLHLAVASKSQEILEWVFSFSAADLESVDQKGCTPFLHAFKANNLAAAQFLHSKKANVNVKDKNGHFPLHQANAANNPAAVDWLLSLKVANIHVKSKVQISPLKQALLSGKRDLWEKYFVHHPKELVDPSSGDTPLHIAAAEGKCELLELLLTMGLGKEERNLLGLTPLACAIQRGQLEAAKLLKAKGATVKVKTMKEETLSHLAVTSGSKNVVNWVCKESPTDLDAVDKDGETPSVYATVSQNSEILLELLNLGAAIKWKEMGTLLHLAVWRKLDKILPFLAACKKINLESTDKNGLTAAQIAVKNKHLPSLRELHSKGASMMVQTKDKDTLLHLAAHTNDCETLEFLLSLGFARPSTPPNQPPNQIQGISPEAKNASLDTPLAMAVSWGNLEAAKKLKERGASVAVRVKDGKTLLHLAAESESLPMVEIVYEWDPKLLTVLDSSGWAASDYGTDETSKWLLS